VKLQLAAVEKEIKPTYKRGMMHFRLVAITHFLLHKQVNSN